MHGQTNIKIYYYSLGGSAWPMFVLEVSWAVKTPTLSLHSSIVPGVIQSFVAKCAPETFLQRDTWGVSRYVLSSTDENFGLDHEGLAVCKERIDPVKKHTVILSLQTSNNC